MNILIIEENDIKFPKKSKLCTKCKESKILEDFNKCSRNKDGRTSKCKECRTIEHTVYNNTHREEINVKNKKYKEDHKEEVRAEGRQYTYDHKLERKQYIKNHKEEIKIKSHNYYEENKTTILEQNKIYRIEHKTEIQIKHNDWERNKYSNDPKWVCRKNASQLVSAKLKNVSLSKNGESCLKYFPWTIEELYNHITILFSSTTNLTPDGKVWMIWKNRGIYDPKIWNDNDPSTWTWQLDHIIPHSTFDYTTMDCEEFRKCWSLENLRPLNAIQNVLDGINRVRHII